MVETSTKYKPNARRKASKGKRVEISPEARAAYEAAIRQREEREREHGQFLPDDMKGKR